MYPILKLLTSNLTLVFKNFRPKYRSSLPEVFLGKGVLKMCSKFIEIPLRDRCYLVNFLYIFKTHFLKNKSGRLLRQILNVGRFGPKSMNFLILTKFCMYPISNVLILNLTLAFENFETKFQYLSILGKVLTF